MQKQTKCCRHLLEDSDATKGYSRERSHLSECRESGLLRELILETRMNRAKHFDGSLPPTQDALGRRHVKSHQRPKNNCYISDMKRALMSRQ